MNGLIILVILGLCVFGSWFGFLFEFNSGSKKQQPDSEEGKHPIPPGFQPAEPKLELYDVTPAVTASMGHGNGGQRVRNGYNGSRY